MTPRLLGLALGLSLTAGCATTLPVGLASAEEQLPSPRFTIGAQAGEGDPPRYDTLEVLDDAGDTMWKVRAQSFGDAPRPSLVTYGQTPEAFEAVTPAQPLQRSARYHLFVSASGPKDGNLHFETDAEGRVRLTPR